MLGLAGRSSGAGPLAGAGCGGGDWAELVGRLGATAAGAAWEEAAAAWLGD